VTSYLPPGPDYPVKVRIALQRAPDGHFGIVEADGARLYVRRWVRNPDGTVTAEGQWAEDEGWRAMMEDIDRRVAG